MVSILWNGYPKGIMEGLHLAASMGTLGCPPEEELNKFSEEKTFGLLFRYLAP